MLEQKRIIRHNSRRVARIEMLERIISSTVTAIATAVRTPISACIIGFISKVVGGDIIVLCLCN